MAKDSAGREAALHNRWKLLWRDVRESSETVTKSREERDHGGICI